MLGMGFKATAFALWTVLVLGAASAKATVIDMEGIAVPGAGTPANGTTQSINGFNLQIVFGDFIDSANPGVLGGGFANNGTDWLAITGGATMTLTEGTGAAFSIQSFDSTFWATSFNGNSGKNHEIVVTGAVSGGGTISTSFVVDDNAAFETFNFDSSWTNLVAVGFQNDGVPNVSTGGNMAYDNIVVNESVGSTPAPEPAGLLLFGLGLAGLGFARRRKAA